VTNIRLLWKFPSRLQRHSFITTLFLGPFDDVITEFYSIYIYIYMSMLSHIQTLVSEYSTQMHSRTHTHTHTHRQAHKYIHAVQIYCQFIRHKTKISLRSSLNLILALIVAMMACRGVKTKLHGFVTSARVGGTWRCLRGFRAGADVRYIKNVEITVR
jgi:hypothetical protein